jgi:hypothetical protein
MYIRKCLRETGVYFLVCLILAFLAALLTMLDHGPNSAPPGNSLLAIVEAWREFGFSVGILGALLGNRRIGTDISKGLGDFLLTRPRSRKYFIWTGWAVGIAEILCIVFFTTLLDGGILYRENGPFWRQLPAAVLLNQRITVVDVPLVVVSVLIFAIVAYSATYFVEVLTRGRSAFGVMALLLGYNFLAIQPGWARSHFPSLLVRPYYAAVPEHLQGAHEAAILALIAWSVCALAFALATQLIFERSDL